MKQNELMPTKNIVMIDPTALNAWRGELRTIVMKTLPDSLSLAENLSIPISVAPMLGNVNWDRRRRR